MRRYFAAFAAIAAFSISSVLAQTTVADWYNLSAREDGVYGIDVRKAYKTFNGMELDPVVVAVIDDGVDVFHPDLESVMWRNEKEIADNNIDDDGNGYVDDIYGWNFLGNPAGENIKAENLEITRLYREYKARYDSVDVETLSKEDREEYRKFKAYESEYQAAVQMINEQFSQFAQLAALYKGAMAYMKERVAPEELTYNSLYAYQPTDEDDAQVKNFLIMAQQEGLSENLEKESNYFKDALDFHYNLDFNPRTLVNEKTAAEAGIAYGNNMVWAENPEHGTHVAGIIGALRNNALGVDGVARNARIMALRAVPNGDERDKDVALAIRYAADNGAKVINMSFGKSFSPNADLVKEAIAYAAGKDVLMIHAAGNDNSNNDRVNNYPSGTDKSGKSLDQWISVAANDQSLDSSFLAVFSNYGKKSVDVLAPGVNIESTIPGGGTDTFSGTSMAAPVVSGMAVVLRGAYPQLSAAETKELILASIIPEKKLIVTYQKGEAKLKKLVRNPGVPSLEIALALARDKYKN